MSMYKLYILLSLESKCTCFILACPTGEAFCNLAAEVYYEFVQSSVSWEQAQQDCVNRGGQLAVLDTERKFSWMQELRMAQQTDSLSMCR